MIGSLERILRLDTLLHKIEDNLIVVCSSERAQKGSCPFIARIIESSAAAAVFCFVFGLDIKPFYLLP